MSTYIARRLLLLIPTLLLVTILVFLSIRFIPGDIIELMLREIGGEGYQQDVQKTAADLRHAMGLDVPVHIQYIKWLGGVFRGDLGASLWTGEPITRELAQRIPVSMELGLFAMVTALLIALPIGTYSAIRQDTGGDYFGRTVAILFISVPNFWVATMVVVYPSIWWNWVPPLEYIPFAKDPVGNFLQFLLPGVIMGSFLSGTTMRMTRTMMLEVLRQDYIRTAWSKGLNERTIIVRHALKNALIPVVTIVGNMVPLLIGGSVVIEQIFTLPGVGRYLIEAISKRDYNVIIGIDLAFAIVVLFAILTVDLTYGFLDPRIKYK